MDGDAMKVTFDKYLMPTFEASTEEIIAFAKAYKEIDDKIWKDTKEILWKEFFERKEKERREC